MQNKFSNCFCMRQIHHIRLLVSLYCIKIQEPIIKEGFPGKKKLRIINSNVCTSVTSVLRPADVNKIFDDMRKPKPYCSECLVIIIKKKKITKQTKKQKQKTTKELLKTFD